jgi:Outer membrane protein/protective antigen OMA87
MRILQSKITPNKARITSIMAALLLLFCALHAQAQSFYVADVHLSGNKKTKEQVILREMSLHKGDSITAARLLRILNECKENLENLALFNFVEVIHKPESGSNADDRICLYVTVEERWYTWPLINVKLEDRNMSAWLKDFDLQRVTFEFGLNAYNLFGLNHNLVAGLMLGYQQALNFHYRNIALGNSNKHFLNAGLSLSMSRHANVMTEDDSPLALKVNDKFLTQSVQWYANYSYRPHVRATHNVNFTYIHTKLADTVLGINPHYWGSHDTERLNFDLQYFFRVDERDYGPFPTKGFYLKTEARFYVSGDWAVRYAQANANAQYYLPLHQRWFAGGKVTAGTSVKNAKAYILDRALGYGENVLRGYEYHVIDGQHFASFNGSLFYNILPKKTIVINWLSALSKFNKIHFTLYAHAFFDMGAAFHSYPDPCNHLSNQFLHSTGLGLDLVTYYDIILNFNYSINKQGEKGFHLSLKLPFM